MLVYAKVVACTARARKDPYEGLSQWRLHIANSFMFNGLKDYSPSGYEHCLRMRWQSGDDGEGLLICEGRQGWPRSTKLQEFIFMRRSEVGVLVV